METSLKECGFTPKKIELFNRLGFHTGEELLTYYPFRYEQLQIIPYRDWKIGDTIAFEGRLCSIPKSFHFRGRQSVTRFDIQTEEEIFHVSIFNRPWITKLALDTRLTLIGRYDGSQKVLCLQYNTTPLKEQLDLKPVYPLKEGLTQKIVQEALKKCFDHVTIQDIVPANLVEHYRLLPRKEALRKIHFPANWEEVQEAQRTLKYEEFLVFELAIGLMRQEEGKTPVGKGKKFSVDEVFALANRLSYTLTNDQLKTLNEIIEDLQSKKVMYRLVQGDVGCGKTLVGALSLYANSLAGSQGAFLAPTEILAKQHYETLKDLFRSTQLKVQVLYSEMPSAKKKEILEELRNGKIDILVGTHALLQDQVHFKNLGLVVADEQHRFGVEQRQKLIQKGDKVDVLMMTATPIPRTLASSLYGDMDVSTIETMPKGRKGVDTVLIHENSIRSILPALEEKLRYQEQIYIVCAAIEESEDSKVRNVTTLYQNIKKFFKGKAEVGYLHGKLSSEEKETVMEDFKKKKTQILVSTTVIEVGVNVVDATVIVIYDADRFGLSQLHQLRGRVQRGSKKGSCYLLTDSEDPTTLERLETLVKTNDGFAISLEDLKMRGPGDIIGTRQSGLPSFLIGNLVLDTKILQTAKADAQTLLKEGRNQHNEALYHQALEACSTKIG